MNWISFNIENFILFQFIFFVTYFVLNFNYRFRTYFSISVTKEIKLLDCFPCLSFWTCLLITGNPIFAMAIFLFNKLLDK